MMSEWEIVELFFARNEDAIKQTEEQYGSLCRRLAFRVLNDERDAEECVNDAYLALWNTIPPQRPSSLCAYLLRLVRNASVTRYHFNTAQKRNSLYDVALDELAEVLPMSEEPSENALAEGLNVFLESLSESDRVMFVRRYWYSESVKELSARFGKTPHYISVRLSRMRQALKKILSKRGIYL